MQDYWLCLKLHLHKNTVVAGQGSEARGVLDLESGLGCMAFAEKIFHQLIDSLF